MGAYLLLCSIWCVFSSGLAVCVRLGLRGWAPVVGRAQMCSNVLSGTSLIDVGVVRGHQQSGRSLAGSRQSLGKGAASGYAEVVGACA